MSRIDVLGVGFDNIRIREAVEVALGLMQEKRAAYVVTPNPEIVLEAGKNKNLRRAVNKADLVLADGIGVIYASKILGTPIDRKIPGIDFASALMARMSDGHMSVFLLGAKPGVAEAAAYNLSEKYPGLVIAGTNDGYFEDNGAVIDKINDAQPDFLMVCLGFPKQELWMMNNAEKLKVGLMAGLGGSLDVFAGVVERAPKKWQDMGLEWLYRLIKEPKRITRMIKLPLILIKAAYKRLFG